MAQLVKLQDYISRYETDIFRYPSQFIRLKKDQYKKLLSQWKLEIDEVEEIDNKIPKSEAELKQRFLNNILPFQLKWASSTLSEVSFLDQSFERNDSLKFFLQRFPDTYLLLFCPIFKIKKAIIDAEIIIVTPSEILCITEVEVEGPAIFNPIDDRKWLKIRNGKESTIVSPLIALRRMEKTIKSILDFYQLDFPVKKIVLAKDHQIVKSYIPFQTEYVDQDAYEKWFLGVRQKSQPLKFRQLKVCEALLKHTQKTYVKRPMWEDDDQIILE